VAHARVATGLSSTEAMTLSFAGPALDALRKEAGLPPDLDAGVLRRSPFLTMFPAALEDPGVPAQPHTLRFADPEWHDGAAELPDWWEGAAGPLVYVSFGSVAGAMEMAAEAYRAAIDAMAGVDARVLLTVGREADPDAFAPVPPNVHLEPWVPQTDVLAHAAVVVCHGGSGTTLGALAAGLPQVLVPLFADQPLNAGRVAAAGAGLSVTTEAGAIRSAVEEVLVESRFRERAGEIAAEMSAQPPADEAVAELERLAA